MKGYEFRAFPDVAVLERWCRGCNQQELGQFLSGGWLLFALLPPLPVMLGKLLTLALHCLGVKI